jgi:hypothetical protein
VDACAPARSAGTWTRVGKAWTRNDGSGMRPSTGWGYTAPASRADPCRPGSVHGKRPCACLRRARYPHLWRRPPNLPVITEATQPHTKRRDNLPLITAATPGKLTEPDRPGMRRAELSLIATSDNGRVTTAAEGSVPALPGASAPTPIVPERHTSPDGCPTPRRSARVLPRSPAATRRCWRSPARSCRRHGAPWNGPGCRARLRSVTARRRSPRASGTSRSGGA